MNNKVQELKNKIEDLEKTIFYLEMVDRWTIQDFELYDKYNKELKELKELLIQAIIEK
jgi:hypothetical protein